MINCKSLIEQAEQAYEQHDHARAAEIYEQLWTSPCRSGMDHWDGWRYASSLYKTGQHEKAIRVCEEVENEAPLDFEHIRNIHAWALYKKEIKVEPVKDEGVFLATAERILELTRGRIEYTPYVDTVLEVCRYFKEKEEWTDMLEWIHRLPADALDDRPFSFTAPDGEQRELASDLENYYALLSTALFELGRCDECIQCVDEALEKIEKFHYNNDIWMRRRKALCYERKGEYALAIQIMEPLAKKKGDWFLWAEVARLHSKAGDRDKALRYAAKAALAKGEPDKKVNLWELLGDLYRDAGDIDLARSHWALAFNLRQEKGWSIPDSLEKALEAHDVMPSEYLPIDEHLRKLREAWVQARFAGQAPLSGTIKKILPHGHAGFIEADNGRDYYFETKEYKGPMKEGRPPIGQRVSFYLEEGFDKKKNIEVMNAAMVRPFGAEPKAS